MTEPAAPPVAGDGAEDRRREERNVEAHRRLLRFLQAPPGTFGLAVARSTDRVTQARAVRKAREQAEREGIQVVMFPAGDIDPDTYLVDEWRKALETASPIGSCALFVLDLGRLLIPRDAPARPAPAIDGLNRMRDRLPEEIGVPVVLWLSPSEELVLARHARDLNDIVLTRFDFVGSQVSRAESSGSEERGYEIHLSRSRPPRAILPDRQRRRLESERQGLLEELAKDGLPSERLGELYYRVGLIDLRLGDWSEAAEFLERAYRTLLGHEENRALAELEVALSDAYEALGDTGKAQHWRYIAEDRLLTARDTLGAVEWLRRLAWARIEEGKHGRAEALLRGAWDRSEKLSDPLSLAETQADLARLLWLTGRHDEALALQERALHLLPRSGGKKERARILAEMADTKRALGDYAEALRLLREAHDIYRDLHFSPGQIILLRQMAGLRRVAGDLSGAFHSLGRALKLATSLGDMQHRALILMDMATLHGESGDAAGALPIYQEARRIFTMLDDREMLARIDRAVDELQTELRRADEA